MADITLVYDKDRIRLKDLRTLQSQDIGAWIVTLARFVPNGDGYMAHDKAVELVEELSLSETEEAVKSFLAASQGDTDPKSGRASAKPTQ